MSSSHMDSTKATLIKVARELFARNGLDGTTVKDIAEAAGVNVSLISYHFDGKDGLYQACIRTLGQANLGMAQQILSPAQSTAELRLKLEIFVAEFLKMHAENPDVTRIIHREMDSDSAVIQEIFQSTFIETFHIIQRFLTDAQAKGIIRPELNPFILGSLLVGSVVHFGRMDRICVQFFDRSIQSTDFLQDVTKTIVNSFIFGIIPTRKDLL